MLRRDFLKLVIGGTTISLWSEPRQFNKLIPFLIPQDQLVPGVATWYATSCRECPAGCGQIVKNREGRAIKAEGNPLHPINAGTLCGRGQAAVQGQYDPDRLIKPLRREATGRQRPANWQGALAEIGRALAPVRGSGRVAVISDLQSGSLASLIRDWLRAFGSDRYLIYEPFNYEPLRDANRLVFGKDVIPDYRLDESDLIVSFGADFLETWISPVKWIRRFAQRRTPAGGEMSKFVYVGPRLSMTAFSADEHILVAPGDERWVALMMLQMARLPGSAETLSAVRLPGGLNIKQVCQMIGVPREKMERLARLYSAAKTPLALAGAPVRGGSAATETAVAANLLNVAARTSAVDFGKMHTLGQTARAAEIGAFVEALGAGEVDALVIIGANSAYSLPPGYRFAEALKSVRTVIGLTTAVDESAALADWALPINTPLESWGGYESETGVTSIMQPVMGTRHDTKPAGDAMMALAAAAGVEPRRAFGAASYRDYVQEWWRRQGGDEPWESAVQRGGTWPERDARAVTPALAVEAPISFSPPETRRGPALHIYPSAMLFDGRGSNKRWLQEIPDVVNHAVWGSWLEMHPKTAAELDVSANQVVEIATETGKVRAPVFLYEGMAPRTLAIQWGQGHRAYGRYAAGRGANAFELLSAGSEGVAPFPAAEITGRFGVDAVVTTDGGIHQQGRSIVSAVRLSELHRLRPEPLNWPLPKGFTPERDLYPPHEHVGHRWGMAVDISRCVGCEACMVACYAENNIAVVGRDRMRQGREMEWIWIDRYYDWNSEVAPALLLPLLCQHCDAAPCEPVCPVFASSHTAEGLNAQVYNRCIGTRYCSHNCPYKVRRFNWRNHDWPEELTWQLNPDVTVRSRGVMEKCTFCVQRINAAEQQARKEARPLRDGEITPACAQTCPASVFTFGDLMDPDSRVSRLIANEPRRFQALQHLNTKPAVIYLKKVVNDSEPA
jgi:molybdopterin-containing oxidoreductase family iron-sulfur binding subunit